MNRRNRVAYSMVIDVDNSNTPPYRAATFYSYDPHGNVDTLLQDYGTSGVMYAANNRFKLTAYNYDLVSGKVNQVSYQPHQADAFYHQYSYDAENRIVSVLTSTDSLHWESDANYTYYRHGPLAQTSLGNYSVQDIDYAYTVQGWLKSINPSWITPAGTVDQYDSDGTSGIGGYERDAYKLNLNYFDDGTYTDFMPVHPLAGYVQGNGLPSASKRNLYNGNIGSMAINIRQLGPVGGKRDAGPMLYNYGYDQLNRISSMDAWAAGGSMQPVSAGALTDYAERYTYDPNGNILTLNRNGDSTANAMDQLSYKYIYAKTAGGNGEYVPGQIPGSGVAQLTNQLSSIQDAVTGNSYTGDLKSQSALNYTYDAIGELTGDAQQQLSNITWNVYGKILSLSDSGNTISFTYDAAGNRISKAVTHGSTTVTTWYVRDAQGNVMSVYTQGNSGINSGSLTQAEADLYGSSRLGLLDLSVNCGTSLTQPILRSVVRGNKLFELTNHLGNVLETVSDRKVQHTSDSSTVDYYLADVINANDYYPFGMEMPVRSYNATAATNYRYGFNGKEDDNEVKGVGNWQDYGMRMYDPRIGRFPSVDPLTRKYPWYSPYQFAGNKPVWKIDMDGMEENEGEADREEKEQLLEEEDKEEEQLKIRNALKSPTAEEQAKQKKEFEEFSRKPPDERAKISEGILIRARLVNNLKSYVQNGFEAAKLVLAPTDEEFVKTFMKNRPPMNFGVPKFDEPLSTDALRVLSEKLGGVEVAQIYVKQVNNKGFYSILYGNNRAITIPSYSEGTPYLLGHVHPSGNPAPSQEDIDLLTKIQEIQRQSNQPVQSSSTIIPIGKPNVQFNINTKTVNSAPASSTSNPSSSPPSNSPSSVNVKPLN